MAGNRRQRDVLNALDQLARTSMPHGDDEEPADALSYVLEWVEQGKTMTKLAENVSAIIGYAVHASVIHKALRSRTPNATELIQSTRVAEAAHALVDQAQDIIDDDTLVTREQIQRAKQKADLRMWRASRLAPNDYGERRTVDVNINLPAAHLAALQRINTQRALGSGARGEGVKVIESGVRDSHAALTASVLSESETIIEVEEDVT